MQKSFGQKQEDTPQSAPAANLPDASDLITKEKDLSKREGILEERERILVEKAKQLEDKLTKNESIRKDLIEKLEKVSKLAPVEAQKILLDNLEYELTEEISKRVRAAEEKIKLES